MQDLYSTQYVTNDNVIAVEYKKCFWPESEQCFRK